MEQKPPTPRGVIAASEPPAIMTSASPRWMSRKESPTAWAPLAQAVAATTDAGPIDAAIAPRGRSLFVLNGGGRSIQSFAIGRDGQLQGQGRIDGLPAGANGLAAN